MLALESEELTWSTSRKDFDLCLIALRLCGLGRSIDELPGLDPSWVGATGCRYGVRDVRTALPPASMV